MKRIVLATFLVVASACSSGSTPSSHTSGTPGHGQLVLSVTPNPIMATKVSGDTYDFPFTIRLKETGGAAVHIDRVSADVTALGGLKISSATYSSSDIAAKGYPTEVPANGEVSYAFNERHSVPDDRLFSAVTAELTVDGTDPSGATTSARTTVTVRR